MAYMSVASGMPQKKGVRKGNETTRPHELGRARYSRRRFTGALAACLEALPRVARLRSLAIASASSGMEAASSGGGEGLPPGPRCSWWWPSSLPSSPSQPTW